MLFYLLYPFFRGKEDHTNYLKSALAVSLLTTFIVHAFYIFFLKFALTFRSFTMLTQSICCFILVIIFGIVLGLSTFGITVEGLLLFTISLGLPNAALPYLEQSIDNITQRKLPG